MTQSNRPHFTTDLQQEQSPQPTRKHILKNPRYLLIGSLALVTLVLMVGSIMLYMQRSTHQATERAWITVRGATIIGPLIQHNVPKATIHFHNSGRSPALTTDIRLVMTVWTSNKLPDWQIPPKLTTDPARVGDIGPGAVVSRALSLMTPLTDEQGIHLERKDWFIVILGLVSYLDIFGNPHETKLCLIWRETSNENLSPCEKWNDAD